MDFCMGLVPSMRGISWTSPSFWLGGARVGNALGNMSRYLHNVYCNVVLYYSSILSNVVLLLLEDLCPHIKYLIEIKLGFQKFLITYHM